MTMIQILAQDLVLANGPTIPKLVRMDLTSVLYNLTVFEPVSQPDTEPNLPKVTVKTKELSL